MIIYATQKAVKRLNLPVLSALNDPFAKGLAQNMVQTETLNPLLVWGAKLMYISGKKSLVFVHKATKLTVVLPFVKANDDYEIANDFAFALEDLFRYQPDVQVLIGKMFEQYNMVVWAELEDAELQQSLDYAQDYITKRKPDLVWEPLNNVQSDDQPTSPREQFAQLLVAQLGK